MYKRRAQYTAQKQVYEKLHPHRPGYVCPRNQSEHLFPPTVTPTPAICWEAQEDACPPTHSDVNTQRTQTSSFSCPASSLQLSFSPLLESFLDLADFSLFLSFGRSPGPSASSLMKSSINNAQGRGNQTAGKRERYGQVERGREVKGWRDGQQTSESA